MDEEYKSKNISELDLEIIELASKIKNLIKENWLSDFWIDFSLRLKFKYHLQSILNSV